MPQLPCSKCGNADVNLQYCPGDANRIGGCREWNIGEHFHRYCRRCTYRWITDDVLNPSCAHKNMMSSRGGPSAAPEAMMSRCVRCGYWEVDQEKQIDG